MNSFIKAGLLLLTLTPSLHTAFSQSGPTPYPVTNSSWPGKGPVRMFGWFNDNRKAFWADREKSKGAVVFTGDSLIAGWKGLAASFPTLKIANRGIGGDVSRGLLFRYQEDVLDLNPKAIVILIGANDLSAHGSPDATISNLTEIIAMTRKANPTVPMVLCTVPPRDNPKAPTRPGKHEELNQKIAVLAQANPHVKVADIYPALLAPDGKFESANFAPDRLHISAEGYTKITPEIQKALTEEGIK